MTVHVFVTAEWTGKPGESDEIKPVWYNVADLPFDRMWQDSRYWLPDVLAGNVIEASFTFQADNESIERYTIRPLR
jgi:8-oxo-dGTP diphosphatase